MLYKWLTAVHFKGNPLNGPMVIEKAYYVYDEMKISDECIFSDGWLQCDEKLCVRNVVIIHTV
jgi:hypothetical protein